MACLARLALKAKLAEPVRFRTANVPGQGLACAATQGFAVSPRLHSLLLQRRLLLRLLPRLRNATRAHHLSRRTEQAYTLWARRFLALHQREQPSNLGTRHVNDFITRLASERNVSASTQSQALAAISSLHLAVGDEPAVNVSQSDCRVRVAHRPGTGGGGVELGAAALPSRSG